MMSDKYISSSRRDQDSCALCLKYLLITINSIFFGCSCAIIGVGIWILLERNFISIVFGSTLLTAAIIMCIAGSAFLIIIITIFGCCGVFLENKCMLITYFILLIFAFVGLVVAGTLAVVFRTQVSEEVKTYMTDTLREDYGINLDKAYNRLVTEAWDKIQTKLDCCAVDERGWAVYAQSDWFKANPSEGPGSLQKYVPESCCKEHTEQALRQCQSYTDGPPGGDYYKLDNPVLHKQGCYQEGEHWAMEHSRYFIGIGLGIGLTLIFAMILTVCYYRSIASLNYSYTED